MQSGLQWLHNPGPKPQSTLVKEILHQLIGSLSHYLQCFIHPRWCRISSINSIMNCPPKSSVWMDRETMFHYVSLHPTIPPPDTSQWGKCSIPSMCLAVVTRPLWLSQGHSGPNHPHVMSGRSIPNKKKSSWGRTVSLQTNLPTSKTKLNMTDQTPSHTAIYILKILRVHSLSDL